MGASMSWWLLHQSNTSTSDEDITTIVTPTAPTATYTGPITRARARQLNYQGLAWIRGKNIGARPSMEMMTCARGTRTKLQAMISGV